MLRYRRVKTRARCLQRLKYCLLLENRPDLPFRFTTQASKTKQPRDRCNIFILITGTMVNIRLFIFTQLSHGRHHHKFTRHFIAFPASCHSCTLIVLLSLFFVLRVNRLYFVLTDVLLMNDKGHFISLSSTQLNCKEIFLQVIAQDDSTIMQEILITDTCK